MLPVIVRLLRRPGGPAAAAAFCIVELPKWHRSLNYKPAICRAFAPAEAAGHSLSGGTVTVGLIQGYLERCGTPAPPTPEEEQGQLLCVGRGRVPCMGRGPAPAPSIACHSAAWLAARPLVKIPGMRGMPRLNPSLQTPRHSR